ncbi:MAG: hypothetical protein QW445_07430 [Candidatus Bathyarchaeia archaeon]
MRKQGCVTALNVTFENRCVTITSTPAPISFKIGKAFFRKKKVPENFGLFALQYPEEAEIFYKNVMAAPITKDTKDMLLEQVFEDGFKKTSKLLRKYIKNAPSKDKAKLYLDYSYLSVTKGKRSYDFGIYTKLSLPPNVYNEAIFIDWLTNDKVKIVLQEPTEFFNFIDKLHNFCTFLKKYGFTQRKFSDIIDCYFTNKKKCEQELQRLQKTYQLIKTGAKVLAQLESPIKTPIGYIGGDKTEIFFVTNDNILYNLSRTKPGRTEEIIGEIIKYKKLPKIKGNLKGDLVKSAVTCFKDVKPELAILYT